MNPTVGTSPRRPHLSTPRHLGEGRQPAPVRRRNPRRYCPSGDVPPLGACRGCLERAGTSLRV